MCLRDGGARAHDLPTLAPGVAWCTQLPQPPLGRRPILCLWQSPLTGGLTCPIDIENDPLFAFSICKPTDLALVAQGAREQIVKKQRAQGFGGRLRQRGQKARERRARRQPIPPEERHEGLRKGRQPIIEGFQGAFATDGIAEKERHKIDHLVVTETAAGKADALTDGFKGPLLAKMLDDQGDFLEYVIMPLSLIVWLVEAIREAVLHLLLSNIPSRACLWPGALRRACLFSAR